MLRTEHIVTNQHDHEQKLDSTLSFFVDYNPGPMNVLIVIYVPMSNGKRASCCDSKAETEGFPAGTHQVYRCFRLYFVIFSAIHAGLLSNFVMGKDVLSLYAA